MTATLAPVVIMDGETTGLNRATDEFWELAARRRDPDGTTRQWNVFVEHDLDKAAQLPDWFRADHDARYDASTALTLPEFIDLVGEVFAVPGGAPYNLRPHVVGAVPDFDIAILERTIGRHGNDVPWHHHITCAEVFAAGYVNGRAAERNLTLRRECLPEMAMPFPGPPWDSNAISRAVGVDPERFARHTALGDVLWAEAIFDAVTGGAA